jgi:acetyl/propionyl-CoA carboxylase alpha subunit
MTYRVRIDDAEDSVEILGLRPQLRVRVADAEWTVVEVPAADGAFELLLNGTVHRGFRCSDADGRVHVWTGGHTITIDPARPEAEAGSTAGHQDAIRAQMPGVVVQVHCECGQRVARGDALVTIESMKLQTTITAPHAAQVDAVHVAPDAPFERGAVLVTFHRPAEQA